MNTNGQKTVRKFQSAMGLVAAISMSLVGPAQAGRITGSLGGSGVALPGSAPTGSASHGKVELNEELLLSDQFDGSWIGESLAMSIAGKKRYLSHQACPQLPDGTNCLSISVGDEDDYSTWTILDNSCTKKKGGKTRQFKSSCWKGYEAIQMAQVEVAPVDADELEFFVTSNTKFHVALDSQMVWTMSSEVVWSQELTVTQEGSLRVVRETVTESLSAPGGAPVVDGENPLCTAVDEHGISDDECTDMVLYERPQAASSGSDADASTTLDGACNQIFEDQLIQLSDAAHWAAGVYGEAVDDLLPLAVDVAMVGMPTGAGARAFGTAFPTMAQKIAGESGPTSAALAGEAFGDLLKLVGKYAFKKHFHRKINKQAAAFIEEFDKQRLDCIAAAITVCATDANCVCEDKLEDENAAKDCAEEKEELKRKGAGETEGDGSHGAFNPGGSCSADWECAGYVNTICVEGTCVQDGGPPL